MKTTYQCPECKTKKHFTPIYRFTDWNNDTKYRFATFEKCLKLFKENCKKHPLGRFSVYDCSDCDKCGHESDEGIIFNKKCPEYS